MERRQSIENRRGIRFFAGGRLCAFFYGGLAFFLAVQTSFVEQAMAINIVMDFKTGSTEYPDFDPTGSQLIALRGAVETYYQDIFEESDHTLTVEFYYDTLDGGTLAVHRNLRTSGGQPTKCRIRFDTDRNWFIDDSPLDNSEFNMQQKLYQDLNSTQQGDWFNGNTPDLLEVTHKGQAFSTAPSAARNYTDMWSGYIVNGQWSNYDVSGWHRGWREHEHC